MLVKSSQQLNSKICVSLTRVAVKWLQVYGTYKQVSDGNNWGNWMTVEVNLNSAEWTFTCIKITEELDLVFGAMRDEDEMYFDVATFDCLTKSILQSTLMNCILVK